MANMEVSLDDIIQKKFPKFQQLKGRVGPKRLGGSIGENLRQNARGKFNPIRKGGGVQQRRPGSGFKPGGQPMIGDARNKIIQKKRLQLTDAREKLCELAKKSDARLKLEKLRESRVSHGVPTFNFGFNGMAGIPNRRPPHSGIRGGRSQGGLTSTSVTLQRTINQIPSINRYKPKVPALMDVDIDMGDHYVGSEGNIILSRTVNNDRMRMEPVIHSSSRHPVSSPYSWKAPQRVTVSRGYIDLDYPVEERKRMKLPTPPPVRPIQISDDEDMGEPLRPMRSSRPLGINAPASSRMGMDVKSRLDASSRNLQSSAQSAGYKIIVSNLQASVTHEDIRELFEDIGPLVASRVVRPGTAEVVYRQSKDAERAVENYHNRQLDGQPMKCLLVKPRHQPSSAPTLSGSVRSSAGALIKSGGSGKSSVVPDISTIHKALFNKS